VTRELILFNFNRWRDRVRELCSSEAKLDEMVFSAVSRHSKQYLLHAAGLTSGIDLQGDVQDLAIYTLFLDVRVVVVHVDMIRANSSEKDLEDACVVAGFEGECEKRRVVCAVLEGGHYDLGVVFRPEVQAVFENGVEWESARTVILHFLRAKKAKPQPKEKWTPSAARWSVTAATPLLDALRASVGASTTPAITSAATSLAASSTTATTTAASTFSATTSATTSASAPATTTTSANTTSAAVVPPLRAQWIVKAKMAPVVFTRSERWDMERVDFVLNKLKVVSPRHHDVLALQCVKEHVGKDGGYLSVEYRYPQGRSSGRVWSGVGFQRCTRATRAFCSARFYVEDDLVNAFPTIMCQVFKQAGLQTPFLDEYVLRREELFQELRSPTLDRDALKGLFLLSLHGGNYRKVDECIVPFLEQFQSELRSCTRVLLSSPCYADFKARVANHRNPLGSAIGLIAA